jgi:hypothetical protein
LRSAQRPAHTLAAAVLVPRFGRTVLQIAAIILAAGFWWLHQVIAAHGLDTTSLSLVAPQLFTGAGIGMLISPLFDFILASVTDDEVGSASGVLNSPAPSASPAAARSSSPPSPTTDS